MLEMFKTRIFVFQCCSHFLSLHDSKFFPFYHFQDIIRLNFESYIVCCIITGFLFSILYHMMMIEFTLRAISLWLLYYSIACISFNFPVLCYPFFSASNFPHYFHHSNHLTLSYQKI